MISLLTVRRHASPRKTGLDPTDNLYPVRSQLPSPKMAVSPFALTSCLQLPSLRWTDRRPRPPVPIKRPKHYTYNSNSNNSFSRLINISSSKLPRKSVKVYPNLRAPQLPPDPRRGYHLVKERRLKLPLLPQPLEMACQINLIKFHPYPKYQICTAQEDHLSNNNNSTRRQRSCRFHHLMGTCNRMHTTNIKHHLPKRISSIRPVGVIIKLLLAVRITGTMPDIHIRPT